MFSQRVPASSDVEKGQPLASKAVTAFQAFKSSSKKPNGKVPSLSSLTNLQDAPRMASPHGNVLERSQKFSNILCPYCYRHFCEKAGARHIEHCREKAKLRYFQKGHVVKNPRHDGSAEHQKLRKGRAGMYQSVVDTTSDKSKGALTDAAGPGTSRNNNKGYYRGLKNPTLTRNSGMKKSATQKQLGYQARMSLTTREPEADVVELKEQMKAKQKDLQRSVRRSYGHKKDSFSEVDADPEKVNDDASSLTSGAHVRSVQNELKAQATYVPEISGIQASDEEGGQLRGGDDHPMNQDVI